MLPSGSRMNTSVICGSADSVITGIGCPVTPASACVQVLATPAIWAYAASTPFSREDQ